MAMSSVRHDFTDTTKKRARSKSVGRSWPGPTGRHLQQGNETAHASARLPIREQRYLSCWSTEFAFAEGHGKNRRVSCGIKARRGWPRKFCLPNHAFNLPRHFRPIFERGSCQDTAFGRAVQDAKIRSRAGAAQL